MNEPMDQPSNLLVFMAESKISWCTQDWQSSYSSDISEELQILAAIWNSRIKNAQNIFVQTKLCDRDRKPHTTYDKMWKPESIYWSSQLYELKSLLHLPLQLHVFLHVVPSLIINLCYATICYIWWQSQPVVHHITWWVWPSENCSAS